MGYLHVSMGPRDGPVSLKNIWTSLQKVKHRVTLWSIRSIPDMYTREPDIVTWKFICKVDNSTTYDIQNVQARWKSIISWSDYTYMTHWTQRSQAHAYLESSLLLTSVFMVGEDTSCISRRERKIPAQLQTLLTTMVTRLPASYAGEIVVQKLWSNQPLCDWI